MCLGTTLRAQHPDFKDSATTTQLTQTLWGNVLDPRLSRAIRSPRRRTSFTLELYVSCTSVSFVQRRTPPEPGKKRGAPSIPRVLCHQSEVSF